MASIQPLKPPNRELNHQDLELANSPLFKQFGRFQWFLNTPRSYCLGIYEIHKKFHTAIIPFSAFWKPFPPDDSQDYQHETQPHNCKTNISNCVFPPMCWAGFGICLQEFTMRVNNSRKNITWKESIISRFIYAY